MPQIYNNKEKLSQQSPTQSVPAQRQGSTKTSAQSTSLPLTCDMFVAWRSTRRRSHRLEKL